MCAWTVYADNMTIQSGALITVSEQLTINATNVDNYGTIKTIGMDSTYVQIYSPFNNYGVLESYCGGFIQLNRGGNHTGTFTGEYGSINFVMMGCMRPLFQVRLIFLQERSVSYFLQPG